MLNSSTKLFLPISLCQISLTFNLFLKNSPHRITKLYQYAGCIKHFQSICWVFKQFQSFLKSCILSTVKNPSQKANPCRFKMFHTENAKINWYQYSSFSKMTLPGVTNYMVSLFAVWRMKNNDSLPY